MEAYKDCLETDNEIQQIHIGEAHTVVVTEKKLYSWGWNGHFELGRDTSLQGDSYFFDVGVIGKEIGKVKQIAVGTATTMFVDNLDGIWVFGEGVSQGISKLQNFGHKVIQITSRQDLFCLLTTSLRPYFWKPFESRPKELQLNVQIESIAIGGGFVVMVSVQGVVLSFGEENNVGQLGMGDTLPRTEPEVVEELRYKGEKVAQVVCGWSHVVCRTTLKKVYTWGWGQRGQLGLEDYQNSLVPRKVIYRESNQKKVIQVAAGYKCSLLLLENGKVLWCGSNGTINQQNTFCEIDWSIKNPILNESDFTTVRILSTWSKTMSIVYLTMADSRNAEVPNQIKSKIFQTLTTKWEEYGIYNIYAPFIDSISKYFKGKTTIFNQKKQEIKREPQFPLSVKPVSSQQNNQSGQKKQSLLKQFDQQYGRGTQQQQASELRSNKSGGSDKLNSIPLKNQQQQFSPQSMRSVQSKPQEMSEEMRGKLLIIKEKMNKILKIPREQWSESDIMFMMNVADQEILKMIQNLK